MFGFTKNSFINASNEEKTTIVMGGVSADSHIQSAWSKPLAAKFVSITCIGPGGQGGAGSTSTGGGGGGAGVVTSVIYPAVVIPDVIYLLAANGRPGETPNGNTVSTNYASVVSVSPYYDSTSSSSDLLCYASGGNRGRSANGVTVGAAGGSVSADTLSSAPWMSLGLWQSLGGPAGTAGGSSGVPPTTITALASSIVTGGTGGSFAGSTDNASIVGAGLIPTIVAPSVAPSDAPAGFWGWKPICGTGGPGGGGGVGTGGRGGNGTFGSGGGGGGRGSVTGGTGGDAGPGIILVTWW